MITVNKVLYVKYVWNRIEAVHTTYRYNVYMGLLNIQGWCI